MKVRADQLLVTRNLAPSRARAQALILAGRVFVGESRVDKAGAMLKDDATIEVRGDDHPYVSRGGVKLAGALDAFKVDPSGKRCLDLGASTGGFTDCLLRRGAVKVIAVDVGYGQLAHSLRIDPRVDVRERTNARTLEPDTIGGACDLVVVDASFIGLGKLASAIARCTREGGELVALVKPQFEVGREEASKTRGVIRDEAVRRQAIEGATREIQEAGFEILATADCVIAGPKGNLEAFPPCAPTHGLLGFSPMRVAVLEKNGDRGWFALDGDRARRFDGPPFEGARLGSHEIAWSPADLRAPVRPSKIVCIGRNYAAHAKELGNEAPKEPLLFLKAPSSIVGPGEAIVLPRESERVEHEAELGVVIGRSVRKARPEQALDAVYGYTCVCDVTARDLQKKDGQWTRAKGFDTFCPVGPWIETELDPSNLSVTCLVDGVEKQSGRTSQMIFDVATLIAYVSGVMTLEPGDLLVTGTPEGVGPIAPGQRVVVAVEGIGELSVGVVGSS